MRTPDLEICGDSFVLENTRNWPRNHKKRVGCYCGIYTGTVTETPLFTVHLYHSETSGVAEGGKRQILAVWLLIRIERWQVVTSCFSCEFCCLAAKPAAKNNRLELRDYVTLASMKEKEAGNQPLPLDVLNRYTRQIGLKWILKLSTLFWKNVIFF